jgi:hypothetical protein
MRRPGTDSRALEGADPALASQADTVIGAAAGVTVAGVTVAGLAGIAGAISYSYMRMLAAAHGRGSALVNRR